jgi:hypothetical protein
MRRFTTGLKADNSKIGSSNTATHEQTLTREQPRKDRKRKRKRRGEKQAVRVRGGEREIGKYILLGLTGHPCHSTSDLSIRLVIDFHKGIAKENRNGCRQQPPQCLRVFCHTRLGYHHQPRDSNRVRLFSGKLRN